MTEVTVVLAVRKRLSLVVFVAIALFAWAGAVDAAERVAVRTGVHPGFGRLAFDWPAPVRFQARVVGKELTIRFERPLEADFGSVVRSFGEFVRDVRTEPDGRTVIFALARPYELRSARYGKVVAIDLVRSDGPAAAAGAEPVRVRIGEHPGYSRVVFDWLRYVDYRVRKRQDRLEIEFGRPARLDLSRLTSKPPRYIAAAQARTEGGRTIVEAEVPAGSRVRHFRDGTKVVVDVLSRSSRETADKAPERIDPPAARPDPEKAGPRRGPRRLIPPSVAGGPAAGTAPAPQPERATPAPAPKRKRKAGKHEAGKGNGGASQPAVETKAPPLAVPVKLRVALSRAGTGVRVRVPWSTPVAAAVFRRDEWVWAVFGAPATVTFIGDPTEFEGVIGEIEKLPDATVTALRFAVRPGINSIVSRQDTAWEIDFRLSERSVLAGAIEVRAEPGAPTGARIFLPVEDSVRPATLEDPEVGDRVIVVPVLEPGRGIAEPRDYAEFRILRSMQGVAILPRADGVEVAALREGVAITNGRGLKLSQAPVDGRVFSTEPAEETIREEDAGLPLFDYSTWKHGDMSDFTEIQQELQRAIAGSPPDGRNSARMDLARFYLAHDFAVDAIAVLARIADLSPVDANTPQFRALRGAALVMLGRLDQGEADLKREDLAGRPEISLWLGLAATKRGRWAEANDFFLAGLDAMDLFSPQAQTRFRLAWAKAALGNNDVGTARSQLAALEKSGVDQREWLQAQLLRGRIEEQTGDYQSALEAYRQVIEADDRPTRVRAELGLIRVRLAQGDLTQAEAVDALERLRYVWRGDDFELELLHRLGRIYIALGDYRNGLETMRRAVTYFPKSPYAKSTAQAMNEEFTRLFLKGEADNLPPVVALGLYYDFRELTPVGPEGDEMIRQLADRLASVDLLNQAAYLLEHQVGYRLKGLEKTKIATRLAVIYLLDRKPDKALRALRASAWKPLPKELETERRHLRARALADLGRYPEALAALGADDGPVARSLRADIHWRAKNWEEAAKSFAALLGERWKDKAPLDGRARRYVMQLAVSLSLADDRAGLDELKARYGKQMAGTPDAAAFQVITENVDRDATEFRRLASAIAQVPRLEAFMASYREKIRAGQLSAIN